MKSLRPNKAFPLFKQADDGGLQFMFEFVSINDQQIFFKYFALEKKGGRPRGVWVKERRE